jgi:hypothetical protein
MIGYRAQMRVALLFLALLLVSGGCKKDRAPDDDPRAPVDRGPRATVKIAGVSVSDVVGADVLAALTKRAWTPGGATQSTTGPMETLNVAADNGPLHATVSIVRPRTTRGPSAGRATSARAAQSYYSTRAATLLDDPVLVAVAIQGHKDEADKLLESIIER